MRLPRVNNYLVANLVLWALTYVIVTARMLAPYVRYPRGFPPRAVWDMPHLTSDSVLPEPSRRGLLPLSPQ